MELMGLEKQIIKIKDLKQQLTDNAENNKNVIRQITQIILGF